MNKDATIPLPRWGQIVIQIVVYATVVGYAVFHLSHHSHAIKLPAQACAGSGQAIMITFTDTAIAPSPIQLQRCDRVTIINRGHLSIKPALGPHEQHLVYPTFREQILRPGQSMQFQASVPGQFELHDHVADKLETEVTIAK